MLDLNHLKSHLDYCPETGVFTWLSDRVNMCGRILAVAGGVAGSSHKSGYWHIKFEGRRYPAHRLAWFYMTGEWPKAEIDHRNTVKSDNRWENLREATRAQNTHNRGPCGSSGVKGVYYVRQRKMWRVILTYSGVRLNLGYFQSKSEAVQAHTAAAKKLHGEFFHSFPNVIDG